MAKNIGATLSLKDNGFFSTIKNATSSLNGFQKHTTNATGNLKKMGTQGKATGDSLASLAKKALGVVAAYASFRQVISIGKECVDLAMKAEEANVRLNTIMDQIPGITGKAKESVASLCKEMSQQTTISATAQKSGASQLASFQMSADSIEKLLPQLNNLAVANYGVNVSSDQMIQAANMLGKAYSGQTGALSRAGIVMTDAQAKMLKTGDDATKTAALVEILQQNFGDLAKEMANTNEGRILRLKNAVAGIKTTVGQALLPAVTTVVGYVADKIPAIMSLVEGAIEKVKVPLIWIKDNAIPPLITAFGAVKDYVVSAFDNIKNAIEQNSDKVNGLGTVASNIGTVLKNAFELCKPTLIWLKDTALPALVNVFGTVLNAITGIANFFVNNWSLIAPIIIGITAAIVAYKAIVLVVNIVTQAWTAIQTVLNIVLTANPIGIIIVAIGALIAIAVALWMNWDSICQWCMSAFGAVKDFFVSVGTAIGDFFVGLWNGIKDTAVSVWTGITGFLSGAWNTISSAVTSVFTGIGNTIKNVWNGIVNTIKGAINKIIGGINGMIRGAVNGINGLINGINNVTGAVGIPAIPTFTAPQIPLLANGGIIRTAGSVIVGEKGPEMLTLQKGAQVTPLNKTTNTNNNEFNIYINADGKSVDTIVNELVPKLKLALANL